MMKKEEEKYINPLTDFGFKKLFGTELNKDLLIDFLNEILPNRKVKDLTYSTNEHFGKYEIDRKAVFDIYCIGENEERFICLLYTSPSPRDRQKSRMPSSA